MDTCDPLFNFWEFAFLSFVNLHKCRLPKTPRRRAALVDKPKQADL